MAAEEHHCLPLEAGIHHLELHGATCRMLQLSAQSMLFNCSVLPKQTLCFSVSQDSMPQAQVATDLSSCFSLHLLQEGSGFANFERLRGFEGWKGKPVQKLSNGGCPSSLHGIPCKGLTA